MSAALSPRVRKGFSLTEVLVALVLYGVVTTSLMGYHRGLSLSFHSLWQYRELWRIAAQQVEPSALPPPSGWTVTRGQTSVAGCVSISVIVTSPAGRRGELSRLQCP
ncbi:prepilin-type N-terminal cleavage/methylation domain-containing protein [Atlantibacter hermannii]|uniref:prepilin-type N-terminal cleavage/methylation domain-containing protein n=1 Tax=Atlantibacter hermannii TaxID=565 RepID=UPI000907F65A|nr:prepilin-type N-terminal cleavage/methylation domain-containing protein [Atlantibacter hermannii]